MAAFEHKLTRSAGVLGLRSTGVEVDINWDRVIYQESVGVSITTGEEVYRTVFEDGRPMLIDSLSLPAVHRASLIDHPEEGRIWYVDDNDFGKFRINESIVNLLDTSVSTVYFGTGGAISNSYPGQVYRLSDGTRVVSFSIPA